MLARLVLTMSETAVCGNPDIATHVSLATGRHTPYRKSPCG